MKDINILKHGVGCDQNVISGKDDILIRLSGNYFDRPFFRDEQGIGQDGGFFADNRDIPFPIIITVKFNADKMSPGVRSLSTVGVF